MVRKAKSDFIQNELNENMNDSKKFWRNLKKVIPGKKLSDNKISLIDSDTNIEIEEPNVTDYINDFLQILGQI